MNKWIASLLVVVLISGCSTAPDTPRPHPEKYTFQVIGIEIPERILLATPPDVETMIHHTDAEITEYPVVVAGLGESITNDQTEAILLPEDFNVIDGKVVASKIECKLGYVVSVQVIESKNDTVSYHLNAQYNAVAGYDEYDLGNGLAAEMPHMDSRSINTELTQKPNTWVSMGGLIEERSDGKRMSLMLAVKLIPPAEGL